MSWSTARTVDAEERKQLEKYVDIEDARRNKLDNRHRELRIEIQQLEDELKKCKAKQLREKERQGSGTGHHTGHTLLR